MNCDKAYGQYHESLVAASALVIDNSLDDLENKFAPVPPPKDDTWVNILLGFVSMGTPMIGGKFFKDGKLSVQIVLPNSVLATCLQYL